MGLSKRTPSGDPCRLRPKPLNGIDRRTEPAPTRLPENVKNSAPVHAEVTRRQTGKNWSHFHRESIGFGHQLRTSPIAHRDSLGLKRREGRNPRWGCVLPLLSAITKSRRTSSTAGSVELRRDGRRRIRLRLEGVGVDLSWCRADHRFFRRSHRGSRLRSGRHLRGGSTPLHRERNP